jgi:hypothetical protein
MPKIYVIPTESPNAFATGRNPQHASVAVTHGILSLLTDEELEGVLAHELGHVNNRDLLISSVAATLAGAITMLASMGRWAMIFGGYGGRDRGNGGGLAGLFMLIVRSERPESANDYAEIPGRNWLKSTTLAQRGHRFWMQAFISIIFPLKTNELSDFPAFFYWHSSCSRFFFVPDFGPNQSCATASVSN